MALEGNGKKVDIFTLAALVLVVLLFVVGQWLTFSALDSRIEELASRVDVPTGALDGKLERIRDELRAMRKGPAAPEPPPATAAPASGAPGTAG